MLLVTSTKVNEFITFAHELAEASGNIVRRYFRRTLTLESKDEERFNPVTQADRESEAVMREMIEERFPTHAILGEEQTDTNRGASMRWILDPIDGTRSFVMGLPLWGTLIALYDGNTPLLGIMNQPFIEERFEGSAGGSFHLRGGMRTPLKTRGCRNIREAVLGATDPAMFSGQIFGNLAERVKMRRFGGDCYLYCALAAGWLDAIVEADLRHYDVLPLVPIVEGAGGIITDWNGKPFSCETEGEFRTVATGDIHLHRTILKILEDS
ncbi:MAG: histidinol-phosphatase [Hyphomicrobiales bacterium]|nr:histidinol-phosphatase [Hyphomicrobiales bacterium]